MNHEFTIHVGTHANNNSRWNTCKQQFTFPTQVTQPTTTNTGIFPAENGNRENGPKNTPTIPVSVPARFPVLFSHFTIFSQKRFTVGLNSKRSRSGRDFPVPFSTLIPTPSEWDPHVSFFSFLYSPGASLSPPPPAIALPRRPDRRAAGWPGGVPARGGCLLTTAEVAYASSLKRLPLPWWP